MATETRKHNRKQNWQRMTGMALILCLTLGLAWHARKRSLLEQSTRIAILQGISDQQSIGGPSVHWLSDRQILFARGPEREGLYLYNIDTRKETLLRSVSRELQKSNSLDYLGSNFERRVETLRVSPDGTRLLWLSGERFYEGPPGLDRIYGACLDGSHYFECFPSTSAGSNAKYVFIDHPQVQWTGDSRHWVALGTDVMGETPRALLYERASSHKPEIVSTVTSDKSVPLISIGPNRGPGLVLDNHLLAWATDAYMSVTPTVDILDIGIGAHTPVKKRAIPLLPNTTLIAVAFSPQGDRVAWQQEREDIPEWVRILQHWFPQMHVPGVQRESIWVSRIDGTQKHEIGSRNLKADEQFIPQLSDLQWVPGANRLGFRYGPTFYTVSAE